MAAKPLFYPLRLIALVLLGLLVPAGLPDAPPRVLKTPITPRPCRRSKAPQPFAGLIHQPLWEACESGAAPRSKAPALPPPVLTGTRGRQRTGDTPAHCCPDPDGADDGWLGLGHLRANGPPGGKPGRQCPWVSGPGYCYESHGTILQGQDASPDLIVWGIAWRAEGVGRRGTARGWGTEATPGLQWLGEAAEPLNAFSPYGRRELQIKQVHLDELSAVRRAVRDGDLREAEAVEPLSRSPHGVWTAIDPEPNLRLCVRGGAPPGDGSSRAA